MVHQRGLVIVLAFLVTLVWAAALSLPDGKTHIWVLGDKSGLSLLIESARGEWALVNPSSSSDFLGILGTKMPFYKRDLSLIVLNNSNKSSLDSLQLISRRYQVNEVWLPQNQASSRPSNKTVQLAGLEKRIWQEVRWQTWSIPGEDIVHYLEVSNRSLIFANKGGTDFWATLPKSSAIDTLVGPSVGRSSWSGATLIRLFKPNNLFVNKPVESAPNGSVVGQQEIVW